MKRFGTELREQCARRGTIAQICKSTGINRQQFNKYLAGQILPSARNLRKICAYLGVTEEQLMSGVSVETMITPRSTRIDPQTLPSLLGWFGGREDERASVSERDRLPNGIYDCYFPVHGRSGLLVRWVLHLSQRAHGQVFTCRTHVRVAGSGHLAARVKYSGMPLYGGRQACLVGTASMPLQHPGTMTVNTSPVMDGTYFSALAVARRLDSQLALMAALHYRGADYPARDALAAMGLVAFDDPRLDPVIARMMWAAPASGSNWMQSVSGRNFQSQVLT